MDNPDTLLVMCARMDVEALKLLSRTPIWNDVRLIVSTPYFWYLRLQYKLDVTLTNTPGDWKTVYYTLDNYVGHPRPVAEAIRNKESALLVQVLLELGYRPSPLAVALAVKKGNIGALRVLLADERTTLPNHPLHNVYVFGTNVSEIIEALLSDKRFEPTQQDLNDLVLRMKQCSNGISNAIKTQSVNLLRLLLDHEHNPLIGFDLVYAVDSGNLDIVRLVLREGSASPSSASYHLHLALAKGSIEMLQLFLDDGRLSSEFATGLASDLLLSGKMEMTKLLLSRRKDINPNPTLLAMLKSESELSSEQESVYDTLLLDERVDPNFILLRVRDSELTRFQAEVFITLLSSKKNVIMKLYLTRDLADSLKLAIAPKVVGAYRASSKRAMQYKYGYTRFLEALVLGYLSPPASVKWLIERHLLISAQEAARAIVEERSVLHDPECEAYFGYFACFTYGMTLEETRKMMRSEGCFREGIELASRLIGTQLGAEDYTDEEYERALTTVFGI